MTRETKIGLLVGLAFIIVIGILLSDHLTSSTEPPPAPLAGAGSSVRSGVTTPAGQGGQQVANVTPPQVQPQQQVLTRSELTQPPPSAQAQNAGPVRIDVGGPQNPPITRVDSPVTLADQNQSDSTNSNMPSQPEQTASTNQPDNGVNSALRNAARQHGEDVVNVGTQQNSTDRSTQAEQRSIASGTKYVAVDGDTLNKLAGRFMGGNTKANRDAILAANPSMKGDPNRIFVGRTYIIPASVGVGGAPASVGMSSSQTNSQTPAPTAPQSPAPTSENWYIVKSGDSLWRIANDQCGDPGAVAAIQELNKDRLKGENHDIVIEGTKLRLPTKPQVASN